MKCPECSRNVRRGKQGMTCGKCGYQFVIDPHELRGLSDGLILAAARRASANGTYHFTTHQLHAALLGLHVTRRRRAALKSLIIAIVAVGVLAGVWWMMGHLPIVLAIVVGGFVMISCFHTLWGPGVPKREHADAALDAMGDRPPLNLRLTSLQLREPPPQWDEPDVYDYGVERLILVERDELVDLLVRNGMHTDQRALIISEAGYPHYLADRAEQLLEQRPDLPVHLLHDASPNGERMAERMRSQSASSPGAERAGGAVLDLGLSRGDVQRIPRLKRLARLWRRSGASRNEGVPVDLLLYPALSALIAGAIAEGMTLAAFAELQHETDPGAGGYG